MSGSDGKDFDIMCQIIERLHLVSARLWHEYKNLNGDNLNEASRADHDFLTGKKFPIKEEELGDLLEKSKEHLELTLGEGSQWFYLPPLEFDQEFNPILSMFCDLNKYPPDVRFCVKLYRIQNSQIFMDQVFGFRFEMHHPKKESETEARMKSRHGYWHAQATVWSKNVEAYPFWLPDHIPCLPTIGNNPVALIFYMLICLYGKTYYGQWFAGVNIDKKYWAPAAYLKSLDDEVSAHTANVVGGRLRRRR